MALELYIIAHLCLNLAFVLRKKGSKTKKRLKEEEMEKGDCRPPPEKSFLRLCRT